MNSSNSPGFKIRNFQQNSDTPMNLKLTAAYAIGVLALIFVVQNLETVQVNFLLWTVQMPRAAMLLLVFLAGAATAWLIATLKRSDRPLN